MRSDGCPVSAQSSTRERASVERPPIGYREELLRRGWNSIARDEATRLDALVTFDVVFLARHGQTLWNHEGRKQGQLDSPLTAAGERHAADLARIAETLDVGLVVSSPIGRARSTAQTCADLLGRSVEVVDELAEVHHGGMAGLTTPEANIRFPGALEQRSLEKYDWRFPGGESYADADERAALALGKIERKGPIRPLIVSHEMIGRMLLRNLLGRRPADVLGTRQPHDVVYRVDLSSGVADELVTCPV